MSSPIPPEFPGWRVLGDEEVSQQGDMLVCVSPETKKQYPNHAHPGTGYDLWHSYTWRDRSRKEAISKGGSDGWYIYRKGPRRLTGNPYFSKELPLP